MTNIKAVILRYPGGEITLEDSREPKLVRHFINLLVSYHKYNTYDRQNCIFTFLTFKPISDALETWENMGLDLNK